MIYTECFNCGDEVASRKPSQTGASFCSKRSCQNAKARFFRQRKKDGLAVERDADICRAFISAALHEPRRPCPVCGLPNAVPPYVHRDVRHPEKACNGVGGAGPREGLPRTWVDVVHPELAAKARA
jgi:endogenous inhibitor of DNA gyrase (YacG/DUF329 family)